MNRAPKLPKAGKKKKKKRRRESRGVQDPFADPQHGVAKTRDNRPKRKFKGKSQFQIDASATPNIKISGGFSNRSRHPKGGGSGGAAVKSIISTKVRPPKGTRTAISTVATDPEMDFASLAVGDKQYTEVVAAAIPVEGDDSDHEDERKGDDAMDLDEEKDGNEDPWNDGDANDGGYHPVTLKLQPSFGQNGKFEPSEMHRVFAGNGKSDRNEFIFMQLPPVLPLVSRLNEDEQRDLNRGKNVKQSLLRQMGEGQIGTIRVRKSGKTEFVIGNHVLNVDFASPMDCYQQVMHLHCEQAMDKTIKGTAQFLGDVPPQNNLVCSYKVEDLIL